MGWEHLVIRPDTKLSPADRRRVEKAIRRAKKEGKIARTAQQTIPYQEMYQEMYQDGIKTRRMTTSQSLIRTVYRGKEMSPPRKNLSGMPQGR